MAKAVTGGSGNIKFAGGVQTSRSFGPAPKGISYHVHPEPFATAPKAGKAKANDLIYPSRPQDVGVATAAIGSKTFAK
jgi:hypothetical protein